MNYRKDKTIFLLEYITIILVWKVLFRCLVEFDDRAIVEHHLVRGDEVWCQYVGEVLL